MICHGFKGGIGTASRVIAEEHGGYTVGVLVQANHGWRERLTVAGVPVGRMIGHDVVPDPTEDTAAARARSSSWWRPTRRCSRTSAGGSPSAPRWGSRAPAGPASTRAGTS